MKAIAYYDGGHMREIPLEEGVAAALAAPFGPHQALADELREQYQADRIIIRCMGSFVAESEASDQERYDRISVTGSGRDVE